MTFLAILLVLGSGFLHSIWNLFTKRSLDKNAFLWFCQLAAFLIFLPWTIMEWDAIQFTSTAGWIVLASMILHGLYMVLLAATYSIGDLSQVYPIMRGTSPLLVPLLGVTLLNEYLSIYGWIGILTIVAGIALLSNIKIRSKTSSLKAPLMALCVGICIAGYIIVDKIALDYVPAVVLNEAAHLGGLLALSWVAFRSQGMRKELRINWKVVILGGLIAPGGYLLFLYAVTLAPVSQLAPIREIGTVFGTMMGIFILREQQGIRRMLTSILITVGVIILGVWG